MSSIEYLPVELLHLIQSFLAPDVRMIFESCSPSLMFSLGSARYYFFLYLLSLVGSVLEEIQERNFLIIYFVPNGDYS